MELVLKDAQSALTVSETTFGRDFNEALVLATKVVSHPNILAELCISDDPEYVTGYIASREFGYVRVTRLKEPGSPMGGRIFLFRGDEKDREDCIRYLQQQKVLVHVG